MASPSLISPNPGNYRIGKGKIEFKRAGQSEWIHLGNCAAATFTPSIEKLDHFSSLEGLRQKDLSVALTVGGQLVITMEEWTPHNVAMMVMGEVDEGASGGPTIDILVNESIDGAVRCTSSNSVGPRWNWEFYNVSFTPSGELGFISDEWGQMETTGEVLADTAIGATQGKFGTMQLTNADS